MTKRPFSIGAQPNEGFVEAEDFDGKKYIEDIDREAWSRIVYDRELTEQEIEQYELVPAEPKPYFGYVKYADGSTMCHAKGTLAEVKASEEFVIGYKEPYYEETWVVHSPENDFEEPVARFGNVYKLIAWLNEKGE